VAILLQSTIPIDFSGNPDFEPEFKFYDRSLLEAVRTKDETVHSFFKLLALCHTVMPDEKGGKPPLNGTGFCLLHLRFLCNAPAGKLEYQAQSPDEAALVSAARNFGFVFKERSPNTITIDVSEAQTHTNINNWKFMI
jgi:magnesium-transporting ATPase (P-type)